LKWSGFSPFPDASRTIQGRELWNVENGKVVLWRWSVWEGEGEKIAMEVAVILQKFQV